MAGVKITQQQPHALTGRRYGSFAGKETQRNPGTITQPSSIALAMMRYGSFAGKETSAAAGMQWKRWRYWHRSWTE